MIRNCLKCGHTNQQAVGDEMEACPSCGAIYSRVEAAWAARPATPRPPPPKKSEPVAEPDGDAEDINEFALRLREDSLYPTFRNLIQIFYWVLVLIAVFSFIGSGMTLFSGSGETKWIGVMVGLFFGLFFLVVARVMREVSLMLADLSDAAVRIASRVRP